MVGETHLWVSGLCLGQCDKGLVYMSDKTQYFFGVWHNLKFENQNLKTSAESKRDL
jgi:hypothetical protein